MLPHRARSSSIAAGRASRRGSRSATSGPASTGRTTRRTRRRAQLAIYPGGISECEIFFPYGGCATLVEGRPAGREPLRERCSRRGLGGSAARGRPALPLGGRPGHRDRRDVRRGRADDRPPRPRRDGRHGRRVAVADVAVEGGRISAVGPDLGPGATRARSSTPRACSCCRASSTSTPTPGSPSRRSPTGSSRIRSRRRSAARRRSSSFNNPGERVVAGGGAVARRRSARVARARRTAMRPSIIGVSLVVSGTMDDPVGELPAIVEGGVPTAKAFMVYDFRLDERRCSRRSGDGRGAADARGPLRGPGPHRHRRRRRTCSVVTRHRATTLLRDHRPPRRWRPHRAHRVRAGRRGPGRTSSTSRRAAALADEVRRAKAAGITRVRRDVPALPRPHRRALRRARPEERCARYVISPPLRARRRPRRAVARPRRRLARSRRHRPRARPGRPREGRGRPRRPVRPDQQRRPGHRDAPDDRLLARASRRAGSRSSGWSTCSRRRRPDCFGLERKGRDRGRPRRRPRAVRSRRPAGRSAPRTSTTRATTRRTRASSCRERSGRSSSAVEPSSATALRRPPRLRAVRRTTDRAGRPQRVSVTFRMFGGRSGSIPFASARCRANS